MKRLCYDPNKDWRSWWPLVLWLGFGVASVLRDKPEERVDHALTLVVVFLFIVASGYVCRRCSRRTVYDDGDAIVVIKRRKQIRIPFSNIRRVSYNRAFCHQSVILEFFEPCELGSQFEFQVTGYFKPPLHLDVADDLHRRSRCCKDSKSHEAIDHTDE